MQGKGEFTMEFCKYQIALPQLQAELVQLHEENLKAKAKKWTMQRHLHFRIIYLAV